MQRGENISWLDLVAGDHGDFRIQDRGQLGKVVKELSDPAGQHPTMFLFLGRAVKDEALNRLFAKRVNRTISDGTISLRSDSATRASDSPILIADGGLDTVAPRLNATHVGTLYPIKWGEPGEKALWTIYTRLLFLFCDVICIFADDFPSLDYIADFLVFAAETGTASILPVQVRPAVVIVLGRDDSASGALDFYTRLAAHPDRTTDMFSVIRTVSLDKNRGKVSGRYGRLRSVLQHHHSLEVRSVHRARFSARDLNALFQAALKHTAETISKPFDHIRAMRVGNEVVRDLHHHMTRYLQLGTQSKIQVEDLLPSTASACINDHYTPEAHLSDPKLIFERLYRTPLLRAFQAIQERAPMLSVAPEMACKRVLIGMKKFFSILEKGESSSAQIHLIQIMSQSSLFCSVKSNRTCLWCRFRSPLHRMGCGHSLCDICVWKFGTPASDIEFRFTLHQCGICLSQVPLVVDLVPPTKRITILTIDGGGVRGAIPLEWLVLLQEKLGPQCPIQDLFNLIMGTSSGGLIAECLAALRWDVPTSSDTFDQLVRRVFRHRLQGSPGWLCYSVLGTIFKWLTWWLHDGLYDANILDSVLREISGSRRIFDAAGPDSSGALISRARVGVVATNISRKTSAFVFGNFNSAHVDDTQQGYVIVRPDCDSDEPFLWQAARATSAAPVIFPPAYIRALGTFQDGGLKWNNPANIARHVSRQIWPSKKRPALLVSMGTGTEEDRNESTMARTEGTHGQLAPHFRNVFKDGFARRTLHAWLSSLDGEEMWTDLLNQLDDKEKADYMRLNVPLGRKASSIDNVSDLDSYRNLVLCHPSTSKMVAEVASALLISCFYFELLGTPVGEEGHFRCSGIIRCQPAARAIVPPLKECHGSRPMYFVTDKETLGCFLGLEDICPSCSRYRKAVSFRVRHPDETITIYLRIDRNRQRKISGFPDTVSSFVSAQGLASPFGTPHHGSRSVRSCEMCNDLEHSWQQQSKKRGCSPPKSLRPRKMTRQSPLSAGAAA
ncbi:hypothetical protein AJ80_09688 [Polytolypa hystricis UAMH7299]|uniref:PNPLA domain-containing protein n=1 Tax=Polytolypa hystricis (strain UAMH7299) TaxID=1447883 RepID=A0A2B7WLW9_POLH7|nr:hypothetical protein AJ80_09688 [Polytolypa hystricis UAMH7299]